ncbi:DNA repair protein RadA [Spirochaeta thermophila]|uniref:DNA repair protein RadA n=1 Tax=Winmispira thermophila (strain ATCC 49972 / DSM 6192 / RI 19.B1) TaxID=665571 RepID=E0RNB8_WINT6|nr:DNA repair protein RadA [Spirochaeta thermophila]ADN01118.1 hypothetical protein STHERM_c01420 [Spirochaeta thermophila DSM 6192]
MGKGVKSRFVCTECGYEVSKWVGKCPGCGAWNSMVEEVRGRGRERGERRAGSGVMRLPEVVAQGEERIVTGVGEFDRVLGGGLVRGSVVLVGGEPGVGKSTLVLQVAARLAGGVKVVYAAGEESVGQVAARAARLGCGKAEVELAAETQVESLEALLRQRRADVVVVDSLQMLYSPQMGSAPGTVNQLKFCAYELAQWAREQGGVVLLVAHVTKEGVIAGPKQVEHMVDTVLYVEAAEHNLRILRGVKNRFGSVDEIGVFEMTGKGLVEVAEVSRLFLVQREGGVPPGVVVAPVVEGSRAFLVEIQALTVPAKSGVSRVYAGSIEPARVSRVAAVLEKHVGVQFGSQDLYVNVAGGLRVQEVGVELPLAMALYSARTGLAVPAGLVVVGELSLAGEVRAVRDLRRRVRTARELGFERVVSPPGDGADPLLVVRNVKEAVRAVFGAGG